MNFKLEEAVEVLDRTPKTLECFLSGLSEGWLHCNEGEGTWNPYEVIGHLIEAEKNNWIPRIKFLLDEGENKTFPPFDRFSHLNKTDQSIEEKLLEFKSLRTQNINHLKAIIKPEMLERTGLHPEFGQVKLRELLSAWVVHDFTHIYQIVRVMAKRYSGDVGPWIAYLGILKR